MKRKQCLILFFCLCLVLGWSSTTWGQSQQNRNLSKFLRKHSKKPLPQEQKARQDAWKTLETHRKKWDKAKADNEKQARLAYARRLAQAQSKTDKMAPLKQQGKLGKALRSSAGSSYRSYRRQQAEDARKKKELKYKFRNLRTLNPPMFPIEFSANQRGY